MQGEMGEIVMRNNTNMNEWDVYQAFVDWRTTMYQHARSMGTESLMALARAMEEAKQSATTRGGGTMTQAQMVAPAGDGFHLLITQERWRNQEPTWKILHIHPDMRYAAASDVSDKDGLLTTLLLAYGKLRDAVAQRRHRAEERAEAERQQRHRQQRAEAEREQQIAAATAEDHAARGHILAACQQAGRWEWPALYTITLYSLSWHTGDGTDCIWASEELEPDEQGYITGYDGGCKTSTPIRSVKLPPDCFPVWERQMYADVRDLPYWLYEQQEVQVDGVAHGLLAGSNLVGYWLDDQGSTSVQLCEGPEAALQPVEWVREECFAGLDCLNHTLTLADLWLKRGPDTDDIPF